MRPGPSPFVRPDCTTRCLHPRMHGGACGGCAFGTNPGEPQNPCPVNAPRCLLSTGSSAVSLFVCVWPACPRRLVCGVLSTCHPYCATVAPSVLSGVAATLACAQREWHANRSCPLAVFWPRCRPHPPLLHGQGGRPVWVWPLVHVVEVRAQRLDGLGRPCLCPGHDLRNQTSRPHIPQHHAIRDGRFTPAPCVNPTHSRQRACVCVCVCSRPCVRMHT